MHISEFDFELPPESIAQTPAEPRDSARLLQQHPANGISDHIMHQLPSLLTSGDLLVFNNTKVFPARLHGKRDTVALEIMLHKPITGVHMQWRCFARPAKRLKIGQHITFAEDFSASVEEKLDSGEVVLAFDCTTDNALFAMLERYGSLPLPPYIKRPDGNSKADATRYQTIYAQHTGSVAAPTAGLHYTPALLAALDARGIQRAEVTLHVGAGTFLPVKVEDTTEHVMHSEYGEISAETAEKINRTRKNGGRIIPVGTTSLRLLESAAKPDGTMEPFAAETDIFITPGYVFKCADGLLTNFHLPKSTLFMLVSALAGCATMKKAYQHAIDSGYRFYSYGDCCLLWRSDAKYSR